MSITVLDANIAKGSQTVDARYVYQSGEQRVRLLIHTDSIQSQSYARAQVWSQATQTWNTLTSIHYSHMRSTHAAAYHSDWVQPSHYEGDRVELLRLVKALLPGWDGGDQLLLDPEQLAQLRLINSQLYGDGTSLSPDRRRDLADSLRIELDQIRDQNEVNPT